MTEFEREVVETLARIEHKIDQLTRQFAQDRTQAAIAETLRQQSAQGEKSPGNRP